MSHLEGKLTAAQVGGEDSKHLFARVGKKQSTQEQGRGLSERTHNKTLVVCSGELLHRWARVTFIFSVSPLESLTSLVLVCVGV